jgi:hypothetical protein
MCWLVYGKGENMKNRKIIANSTLKVVASENLDVSADLESSQNKTISELLNDKKEKEQDSTEKTNDQ